MRVLRALFPICNMHCNRRALGRPRRSESTKATAPTLVDGMQRLVEVAEGLEVCVQHNESPWSPPTVSVEVGGASTCQRPRSTRHEASSPSEYGLSMLLMGPRGLAKEGARAAVVIILSPWSYRATQRGHGKVNNRHCKSTCEHVHAADGCQPSPYIQGLEVGNRFCGPQGCM